MSNLLSPFTGGSTPTITNPFTPFPITTATEAFGDISSIGLTPDQLDFVNFFGGEQDERTRDIYARLGLGGSTMEAQDLGGNELARVAQASGLGTTNRSQAIQEQSTLGNLVQQQAALAANTALATQRNQLTASGQQFSQANTALSNLSNLASAFA